ncbi:hypothetical protein AALB64_05275 [Lachnospiraceae bacterium 45-P1]
MAEEKLYDTFLKQYAKKKIAVIRLYQARKVTTTDFLLYRKYPFIT